MNIGRKVILALLASGAVVFIAIGGLASCVVLDGHRQFERAQVRANVQRALGALHNEVEQVDRKLRDWAMWDDPYAYLQDKAPDFERKNITAAAMSGLEINGMLFFKLDGTLLNARDRTDGDPQPMDPQIAQAMTTAVEPANVAQNGTFVRGFTRVKGKTFIVAAAPVIPSDSSAPPSGALVFYRELNDALLAHVSKLTQVELDLHALDEPGVRAFLSGDASTTGGEAGLDISGEIASGWAAITDTHGHESFAIRARTGRPAFRYGVAAVETLLVVMAAGGLAAVALTWFLLRSVILRRLESITHQMGTLRSNNALLSECGQDELGQLVNSMNNLLLDARSSASALETAREKADAANRAKSEFLANMSHEIRTPMTAILGYADLLVDPSSRAEERNEYIATIRRNGEHLLSIINDILDLSKIEANHLVLEAAEVSVAQIVEEVVQSLRPRAISRNLAIESEIRYPVPRTIAGDPLRLRQVLVNLVGNAIKFTEAGSVRVVLSFDSAIGAVRFEVIDTGIGMSEAQVGRLFQPFSQGDNTMSRKFGGTGLGLAISQRLVGMMGGEIQIRSAPGRGSTFSFALPSGVVPDDRLMTSPARRETSTKAVTMQSDLSEFGARVLLAEDGPDNQRLISFLLRKAGLSVVIAENGRVAIETFERAAAAGDPFDLVLMDMQMPVLDGYDATRELRMRGVRTPIIALTAHAMSSDREKCLSAGCDDYASKPIDRGALLTLCEQYLKRKKTLRAA